jgi:hypothetical protein
LREKLYLLSFSPPLWSMEEIFSDALGLFGAEVEEDNGYVCYGGLKLGVIPKVLEPELLLFDRQIADGNTCT